MDTLISITLWNAVLLAALLSLQPLVRVFKIGPSYTISNFDARVEEGVFGRRLAMVGSNQTEALVLWLPVVFAAAFTVPNFSQ